MSDAMFFADSLAESPDAEQQVLATLSDETAQSLEPVTGQAIAMETDSQRSVIPADSTDSVESVSHGNSSGLWIYGQMSRQLKNLAIPSNPDRFITGQAGSWARGYDQTQSKGSDRSSWLSSVLEEEEVGYE